MTFLLGTIELPSPGCLRFWSCRLPLTTVVIADVEWSRIFGGGFGCSSSPLLDSCMSESWAYVQLLPNRQRPLRKFQHIFLPFFTYVCSSVATLKCLQRMYFVMDNRTEPLLTDSQSARLDCFQGYKGMIYNTTRRVHQKTYHFHMLLEAGDFFVFRQFIWIVKDVANGCDAGQQFWRARQRCNGFGWWLWIQYCVAAGTREYLTILSFSHK